MAGSVVEEGRCGAVWVQTTLFEDFIRVCNRLPHTWPDNTHHDGTGTWKVRPGERHLSVYTCNNIYKAKGRTYFCELQLSHEGDHTDGDVTWGQTVYDDDGLPPIW